jgi:hypothetical protein
VSERKKEERPERERERGGRRDFKFLKFKN